MQNQLKNIPIITLYQPWATWIMLGWKTIETRLHDKFSGLKGKTIAIHAGMKTDFDALHYAYKYIDEDKVIYNSTLKNLHGYVICTAFVEDTRWLSNEDSKQALIDCYSKKRYGLVLTNVKPLDEPILAKGKQGVWFFGKRD